jgi:hypothetical protein
MIVKPRYAVEPVPPKFVGSAYSWLKWHVVLIGTDGSRSPAGRARDGLGRRYATRQEAAEACRSMNATLDQLEAQRPPERDCGAIDAAMAVIDAISAGGKYPPSL